jgi:hypothetical protein
VFVSGSSDTSIRGQPYTGSGSNAWLSCFSLPNFDHQWTREFGPNYQVGWLTVADSLGSIYQLTLDESSWNFEFPSNFYTMAATYSPSFLRRWDSNGNLLANQFVGGVAQSILLDVNGTLTLAGNFQQGSNAIVGLSAQSNDGFLRKYQIDYNCSCSDLNSLIADVQQLLNIAPTFTSP